MVSDRWDGMDCGWSGGCGPTYHGDGRMCVCELRLEIERGIRG